VATSEPERRPKVEALGERIRELRVARQLSVRELARRAGCSPSLVSQVERGVTTPSASVVYALANQLEVSLDYLFSNTDDSRPVTEPHHASAAADAPAGQGSWGRPTGPDGQGVVQRAASRRTIELSTGVRWERLTPQHDSRVDFLEVVYAPHATSDDAQRPVRHDGREYLVVIEGRLEADIGFDTYSLGPGDSVAFDPTAPHQYRNTTDEVVRCLSVVAHDPI
jgi:transcriptional regulator with XRE-family HTH domain